jgi:hypothetical protein
VPEDEELELEPVELVDELELELLEELPTPPV